MSNYKFSFLKEKLEGTDEYRYTEIRSRWYLSREGCIRLLGVDPEDFIAIVH